MRNDNTKGAVLAMSAAFGFAIMSALIHSGSSRFSAFEFAVVRAFFGLVVQLPFVWKWIPNLWKPKSKILWVRWIAGSLSMLAFFYNLQTGRIGESKLLLDCSVIFITLFSATYLGEILSRRELWGIAISVCGIILLHFPEDSSMTGSFLSIGLMGALMAAVAYMSLRKAVQDYSGQFVVWGLNLVMLLTGLVALPFEVHEHHLFKLHLSDQLFLDLGLLLGVAVSGLAAQLVMTRAYVYLKAAVASSLGLTSVIWAVLIGFIMGAPFPSGFSFICYAVILTGVVILQRKTKRKAGAV